MSAVVSLIFAPEIVCPYIPSSFGIAWLSYLPTRYRKSALILSRSVAVMVAIYEREIMSKMVSFAPVVLWCPYSFIAMMDAITPSTFLLSCFSFVTRLFSLTSV